MYYNTEPGFFIFLFYFTAGMAFLGSLQGTILTFISRDNRYQFTLYSLFGFLVGLLQIAIAQFHSSSTLQEAIRIQKYENTLVMVLLPVLFAWMSTFFYTQIPWRRIVLLSLFFLVLIYFNYHLPYGLRFDNISSVDIISLPLNERLLVLRGEPGLVSIPVRILFITVFAWMLYRGYLLTQRSKKLMGYYIMIASVMLFSVVYVSSFIDHSSLNSIYTGGFGFVLFFILISTLAFNKWIAVTDKVSHMTFYDTLTELPNRALLEDRLTYALATSEKEDRYSVLLMFDIDRFKEIVAAHGHEQSDKVLINFGKTLQQFVDVDATVARIGNDHFAILIPHWAKSSQKAISRAFILANQIMECLRHPKKPSNNQVVHLSVSIGLTVGLKSDTIDANTMLHQADTALSKAKSYGGGEIIAFNEEMGLRAREHLELEYQLHETIGKNELRLYLQSQVNENGKIVGAEALLRWEHPEQGIVTPDHFISIAENSRLILDISKWVFTQVCLLLSKHDASEDSFTLSVNLSPKHFFDDGFVSWLQELCMTTGANPKRLIIEMTENIMIHDIDHVVKTITELSSLGIKFAIDDFGTGYSSLAYLKRLPIHELKIDKSFIMEAPDSDDDAVLVKTILNIAKHLQLKVVAEGVETTRQVKFLKGLKCHTLTYQGYFYGAPEPAEEWLKKRV